MNRNALVTFALGTLLILGCESTPVDRESSTAFKIPAGTKLVVNQELIIPAETASILIQDGKVAAGKKVRHYHPHCRLEVRDRKEQPQSVQPDTFVAVKVLDFYEVVLARPLQVAQLGTTDQGIMVAQDASPSFNYITELRLESESQPNVSRLQCMKWNVPPDSDYVTVEEIRAVLGDLMTIELPG